MRQAEGGGGGRGGRGGGAGREWGGRGVMATARIDWCIIIMLSCAAYLLGS